MQPIYGTTMYGTELILDRWLDGDKIGACNDLILFITINKPETDNNDLLNARDTIEKWIEDNF